MVGTAAVASGFFPVMSRSSSSVMKAMLLPDNLDARSSSNKGLQVKARAQASKINGEKVNPENEDHHKFINLLPNWSALIAAITSIFLTNLDWKPKREQMVDEYYGLDGLILRQRFSIRSSEIGADCSTSIETVMNHLQEAALNHVTCSGLLVDGFGATLEMSKRDLIWVVKRMHVVVDRYPAWGDIVEVETWVGASGRNGMRRDWLVRDCKTGQILTRATSVWVMMNKWTRRLSKMPKEVRREIETVFIENIAINIDEDTRKLQKLSDSTADYIQGGLSPRWNDFDVNQHVNNVKYVGWILESTPGLMLENHDLSSMTLEYRRECGRDDVLQSLTAVSGGSSEAGAKCEHLLQLEDGSEVVRARTEWRPKHASSFRNIDRIPVASS